RMGYLSLLAVGALLIGCGAGLAGWGAYLAKTMPAHRPSRAGELSPEQHAFLAKLRMLHREYSRELAASVPTSLPAPYRNETERLPLFPSIQEAPELNATGVAEQLGLEPEPQLSGVKALLIQTFSKENDRNPVLLTYTFVCASSEEARALAKEWGPPVMQKKYLVVVPFVPNPAVPLSESEPLIRAIGRQLASSDLPTEPQ
ncbi:MAG TPA: hypothetical protein VHB77_14290, partial [Planctomycetaceae bacterium]|nr:hypothetical protein [Planctomycetaceae bacterium]